MSAVHKELTKNIVSNFTGKQVCNKYHKLKGEWKVIVDAKSASGIDVVK